MTRDSGCCGSCAAPAGLWCRPPKFDPTQRAEIKKIALSRPGDPGLPFSTWSLSTLADFLVAEGVVEDISHEGLRMLLRAEGVSFPGRQDLEDQH